MRSSSEMYAFFFWQFMVPVLAWWNRNSSRNRSAIVPGKKFTTFFFFKVIWIINLIHPVKEKLICSKAEPRKYVRDFYYSSILAHLFSLCLWSSCSGTWAELFPCSLSPGTAGSPPGLDHELQKERDREEGDGVRRWNWKSTHTIPSQDLRVSSSRF